MAGTLLAGSVGEVGGQDERVTQEVEIRVLKGKCVFVL